MEEIKSNAAAMFASVVKDLTVGDVLIFMAVGGAVGIAIVIVTAVLGRKHTRRSVFCCICAGEVATFFLYALVAILWITIVTVTSILKQIVDKPLKGIGLGILVLLMLSGVIVTIKSTHDLIAEVEEDHAEEDI